MWGRTLVPLGNAEQLRRSHLSCGAAEEGPVSARQPLTCVSSCGLPCSRISPVLSSITQQNYGSVVFGNLSQITHINVPQTSDRSRITCGGIKQCKYHRAITRSFQSGVGSPGFITSSVSTQSETAGSKARAPNLLSCVRQKTKSQPKPSLNRK